MNRLNNTTLYTLLVLLILTVNTSCINDANKEEKEDYKLTDQSAVDNFVQPNSIGKLVIKGPDINNISSVKVKHIEYLLVENTTIESFSVTNLNSITDKLEIRDNPRLKRIAKSPLKFVNDIVIANNDSLTDLSGLETIKLIEGDVSILNNVKLGKDVPCENNNIMEGFCMVKQLYDRGIIDGSVTLQNNHPQAATDISAVGTKGGYIDYTLRSQSDIDSFAPQKDTVMNLTLSGPDITYAGSIPGKITTVKGVLTIENTSLATTEGFIEKINIDSSIVVKNNDDLNNPNGFKTTEVIRGDLIIENNPNLPFHWVPDALTKVDSVYGDLRIVDNPKFNSGAVGLQDLVYVGGDFEISGSGGDLYNLGSMSPGINYIGGNFILEDNTVLNSLIGLQNLEHIGGSRVVVRNNGGIARQDVGNGSGFCVIKEMTIGSDPVINLDNTNVILKVNNEEESIDLAELSVCE